MSGDEPEAAPEPEVLGSVEEPDVDSAPGALMSGDEPEAAPEPDVLGSVDEPDVDPAPGVLMSVDEPEVAPEQMYWVRWMSRTLIRWTCPCRWMILKLPRNRTCLNRWAYPMAAHFRRCRFRYRMSRMSGLRRNRWMWWK